MSRRQSPKRAPYVGKKTCGLKVQMLQYIATDHNSLIVTARFKASKCSESFENSTMSDSGGGFGNQQRCLLLSLIASCAAALFV